MIIYLVRHAEYISNPSWNHLEAAAGAGLSGLGIAQAEAVGKKLKKLGTDKIFSSPYKRAKETSEIIQRYCKVPIIYNEKLGEQRIAAHSRDSSLVKELKQRSKSNHDFVPPDGESFNQAAARFLEALRRIAQSEVRCPCVVSHALVIQGALVNLFSLREIPEISEASISAMEYNGSKFKPLYINKRIWSLGILTEKAGRRLKTLFHLNTF